MASDVAAPMLQGPSSLPSSERQADDTNDFVVITDPGSTNGFEESDLDLLGSLSQADAVAQLKEVLQQRDTLQSKFVACTKDLDVVTRQHRDLQAQEKQNCDLARKRIEALTNELNTLKDKLGPGKQSTNVKLTLPITQQPEEHLDSSTLGLAGLDLSASTTDSLSIEELKNQLRGLRVELKNAEARVLSVRAEADARVARCEQDKERAVRQTSTMSTRFAQFRTEKENEFARIRREPEELRKETEELKDKCSILETQLREEQHRSSDVENHWQREYMGLQATLDTARRERAEVDRLWQSKSASLENVVRQLEEEKSEVIRNAEQKYKALVEQFQSQEVNLSERVSECERKNTMIETLRRDKSNAEYKFEEIKTEVRKKEDLINVLRSNIKESVKKMSAAAAIKKENQELKQTNAELSRKVGELNQRLEEYNLSVGDEVPELIKKLEETKAKLKTEQTRADEVQEENEKVTGELEAKKLELQRKEKHVDHLNTIVTAEKKENARQAGEIIRLRQEIGELNSRNVNDGRGMTLAAPERITNIHTLDDLRNTPIPTTAAATVETIQCPFDCNMSGDADFIANHIARDHPEVQ